MSIPEPDKYLLILKAMLRVTDNTLDELLRIYLDMAAQSVMNYTNRMILPPELWNITVRMAAAEWAADAVTGEEGAVDSVSLAGATVRYGVSDAGRVAVLKAQLDDRVGQTKELNQFRLLYRSAPAEPGAEKGDNMNHCGEKVSICLSADMIMQLIKKLCHCNNEDGTGDIHIRAENVVTTTGTTAEEHITAAEIHVSPSDRERWDTNSGTGECMLEWEQIRSKPEHFPPEAHGHSADDISDMPKTGEQRDFSVNPIREAEIAAGAVSDNRIGTRTLVDNAADDTLVPVNAKNLTTWLQRFRNNLKYSFNRLELLDSGISENAGDIVDVKDSLNGFIGLPEWNGKDYTITFTAHNGEQLVIDLPLEGLMGELGLDFDADTGELVFTKNGAEIRIPLADLVPVIEGSTGDNIQIAVDGNIIRATLLSGTIGYGHLTAVLRELIESKASHGALTAVEQEVSDATITLAGLTGEVGAIQGELGRLADEKQAKLISGENIKTVNNQSLVGGGNIRIEGGSGGTLTAVPFTVAQSAWVTSLAYPNFIYQADIAIPNITAADNSIDIIMNAPSVIIANNAHILSGVDVLDGIARLYARKIPSGDITGDYIILERNS